MSRITNMLSGLMLSIRRYPIAMILFLVLAICGIYENHIYSWVDQNQRELMARTLMMSTAIILPAIVSTYIYQLSSSSKNTRYIYLLQIAILLLGVANYMYIHNTGFDSLTTTQQIYQLMFFAISFLSMFVTYYLSESDDNKLRFVDAQIIYSLVISLFFILVINLGIAGIFGSLDYLFDINVNRDYYRDVVICVSAIIGGSLALNNIDDLPHTPINYRQIIYIFAKYIILGLLGIYTIIFLAYGVKILFTGTWPKGQLAYMTIGYFVLGILANVLLYPVSKDESRVKYVYNGFYISSIAILFMGFMAIYLRISDYGITINRYYVLLILAFCALFCIYNLFFGERKIVGLISMMIIFLGVSISPIIGFVDISYSSQVNRFDQFISESKVLGSDGKVTPGFVRTGKAAANLYDQIDYLSKYQNISYLQPYISDSDYTKLSSELNTGYRYDNSDKIRKYIMNGYIYDYTYSSYYENPAINNCNYVYIGSKAISKLGEYDISDYNKMISMNYYYANLDSDNESTIITNTGIIYNQNNSKINIDLSEFIKSKYNSGCASQEIAGPITGSNYALYIQNLNAEYNSGDIKINSIDGYLFVK